MKPDMTGTREWGVNEQGMELGVKGSYGSTMGMSHVWRSLYTN